MKLRKRKSTISITIDPDVISLAHDKCQESGAKLSPMIESLLRDWVQVPSEQANDVSILKQKIMEIERERLNLVAKQKTYEAQINKMEKEQEDKVYPVRQ